MSTASPPSSASPRPPLSRPTSGTTSSPTSSTGGLRAPPLGIRDGGAGLIAAFELHFGTGLRQRCLVHRARNVLAKVSAHDQAEVKAGFRAIFDVDDAEPGDAVVPVADRQAAQFAAKGKTRYPAAVACVTDDLASLTVHLRFPSEHWRRIRHSNFIERTFGETRRRVKVIGRLLGERSCVSLVWAVLDRASRGCRGLTMTTKAQRLLQDLRRQLLHHPPPSKRSTNLSRPLRWHHPGARAPSHLHALGRQPGDGREPSELTTIPVRRFLHLGS
jgi:putative transposase